MPKLKTSDAEQRHIEFRAIVAKNMVLHGLSKQELAKAQGLSRTSLWARLNDPGTFTLNELRNLIQVLNFTRDEITKFI